MLLTPKPSKQFLVIAVFAFFLCMSLNAQEVTSLNLHWGFCTVASPQAAVDSVSPADLVPVNLPHIMRLENKNCGGDNIYKGSGLYYRYIDLKKQDEGKRVLIDFEGVMKNCEVFMNGKSVDLYVHKPQRRESIANAHYGGYLGFRADVTPYVRFGATNVLCLRVHAAEDPLTPPGKPQGKLDFYYYSGIYRDVKLTLSDPLRISSALETDIVAGGGVYISYSRSGAKGADISVKTHILNDYQQFRKGKLITILTDDNGRQLRKTVEPFTVKGGGEATVASQLHIVHAHLWNLDDPYLYRIESKIELDGKVVDSKSTPFGIRYIQLTRDGLFINEGIAAHKPTYLRGTNRHEAFPYVGDAASNSMQERDVLLIKEGGYNAVRAAHYPQDPAFLEACDRHGLLLIECIPGWQYYNKDSLFSTRLYGMCEDMIRRDRNHPSVFLWETMLNETSYPHDVAQKLYDIAHAEMPEEGRMYTSGDYFGHKKMADCFDVLYKQVDHFPKDNNVDTNERDNLLSLKPLFTREWGDGDGEKPRVSLMENEQQQMLQALTRMNFLNGTGYFDWCMLDANPNMAGTFMWSFTDYPRGVEQECSYSGVADFNRSPKFAFYMMKSMQPARDRKGNPRHAMVHIASYNSGDFPSSSHQLTVFSNCDSVRLLRNGKLIGTETRAGRSHLFPYAVQRGGSPSFVFDAGSYQPGTLTAIGYVDGKEAARHEVSTAGKPAKIKLKADMRGITPQADGTDMFPVYCYVTDAAGNLVSQASNRLHIEVEGAGTLIGQKLPMLQIQNQQVEGGIGYFLVRCKEKAGEINMSVSGDGLESGRLTVNTQLTTGKSYPDGSHKSFTRTEASLYSSIAQQEDLTKTMRAIEIKSLLINGSENSQALRQMTDENSKTFWIADSNSSLTLLLDLGTVQHVGAVSIRFQKDSSYYHHRLYASADGKNWKKLLERETTGWDFHPVALDCQARYLRLQVDSTSEGNPGISELHVWGDK